MNAKTLQNGLLVLWCLLLLGGAVGLYTRHNNFPFFYHPDEPGKVEQVMEGKYNFHHPILLLNATRLVLGFSSVPQTEQSVVEAGRLVSACFTGLAVVAFSLLAYVWRGWSGALIGGIVLASHHQLYELGHYMKEDSGFLLGMALTFLATALFAQRPNRWRALGLGLACGVAISGKYLGVLAILVALPVLWCQPRKIGFFTLGLVVTLVAINLPLLMNLGIFEESLGREMNSVVRGQSGMTRSVPHAQYWNVFIDNSTPVIWGLLLAFLVARWGEFEIRCEASSGSERAGRRSVLSPAELALIAFPFFYALLLSFSPKSNDRYFLPATATFTILAVLGIEDVVHWLGGRLRREWVIAIAVIGLVAFQWFGWSHSHPGLLAYDRAFQKDDLAELIGLLKKEVPATAIIAKDNRVNLPNPQKKKHAARMGVIPQTIVAGRYAADLGTVSELRAKGITHVIISESDYGKFFLSGLRPVEEEVVDFERRKSFYEELIRDGELLWEWERGTVIYLHPGLRVYRLNRELKF